MDLDGAREEIEVLEAAASDRQVGTGQCDEIGAIAPPPMFTSAPNAQRSRHRTTSYMDDASFAGDKIVGQLTLSIDKQYWSAPMANGPSSPVTC